MGIDQYGTHYDNLGEHPRKALMDKLYIKHAEKMYVDDKDGNTKHVGYIIGGLWINLYTVSEWNG